MLKKIITEKILIYLFILAVGIAVTYGVHMKETGYTDKNGNYVKGTLEIAAEHKQRFIDEIEALGFTYTPQSDSYMTFKKDAQIGSVLKLKADFTSSGEKITDYICDVYFENSHDTLSIEEVYKKIVPDINLGAEFSIALALEEFNNTHVTITRESPNAYLDLKPIEGFDGVVVSLRMKQK